MVGKNTFVLFKSLVPHPSLKLYQRAMPRFIWHPLSIKHVKAKVFLMSIKRQLSHKMWFNCDRNNDVQLCGIQNIQFRYNMKLRGRSIPVITYNATVPWMWPHNARPQLSARATFSTLTLWVQIVRVFLASHTACPIPDQRQHQSTSSRQTIDLACHVIPPQQASTTL